MASSSPPLAVPATSSAIPLASVASPTLPPSLESVAIVAYVPGNHVKFVNQTQRMLWASWNYSTHQVPRTGRGRTDLIIFAHAKVVSKMPKSCIRLSNSTVVPIPRTAPEQCYVIEHTPAADDYWHRYAFMFSLAFLAEPAYRPLLGSYDRLLRTDTDVGITPAFMTFRPRQFVAGRGGYMYHTYTQGRIKELASDLNMTHQGLHSIGSTWFGRTNLTLAMIPKMLDVAQFILESPKYKVEQGFPKWHLGVTSMHAGELVVNDFIPKEDVWINSANLDVGCNERIETAKVYHCHCWPGTRGYFTKIEYERGEYNTTRFPRDKLDMAIVRDYFMAIVLYGY